MITVSEMIRYQDMDRSDSIATAALQQSKDLSYVWGWERGLSILGGNCTIIGDYEKAVHYIEKSLDLADEHELGYARIKALNLRGIVEYYRGQYQKGIETNIQILNLVDEFGQERNRLTACNNIGINYERLKEFDKALEYYGQALDIAEELKEQYTIASISANIGIIHKNQGNLQEAKNRFIHSIHIAEDINQTGLLVDELHNLTDLYIIENNIDSARLLNQRALKIANSTGDQNGVIRSLSLQGTINEKDQDYRAAINSLKSAKAMSYEIGDKEELLQIYNKLQENYNKINQRDSAYKYLLLFSTRKDSIFNTEKTNELNRLETAYRVAEKDKEILTQQIEIERKTRQRNVLLTSAIILVLLGVSLYFVFSKMIEDQRKIAQQQDILHEQEIEKLQQEKRIVSLDAMLTGQEAERRRIATDLHDSLGSLLASVKLHYQALFRGTNRNDQRISRTENLIDEACDEVRRISHNMMPQSLLEVGLIEALKDLAHDYAENNNWDLSLHMEGVDYYLQDHQEDTIFRIIQEIITNISKHANATEVDLKVSREEDLLVISVSDNGTGFTSDYDSEGIGLKNIRSRVDYLDGRIQMESTRQKGTHFQIEIPLDTSSI